MKKIIILSCWFILSCNVSSKEHSLSEQEECDILNCVFTYKDSTKNFSAPIMKSSASIVNIANAYLDTLDLNSYGLEIKNYFNNDQELQKKYKLMLSENSIEKKCNHTIIDQNEINKLANAKRPAYIYLSKPLIIGSHCLIQINYIVWGNSSKSVFVLNQQNSIWHVEFYIKYSIE